MLFEANQKIVFIGDSITDCGRRDQAAPYGNGYVDLVRSLLLARYPDRQLGNCQGEWQGNCSGYSAV